MHVLAAAQALVPLPAARLSTLFCSRLLHEPLPLATQKAAAAWAGLTVSFPQLR